MSSPAIDVSLCVRQAYDLARAGDLPGAESLCKTVLCADPSRPEALLLRAVVAMRTERPAEALVAARRALPVHPAQAAIHALIGDALYQLQQPLEALRSYEVATQIDAGLTSAQFGRGRALHALQRHREAVTSFDQLLAREPDDFEALMARGRALFELKDLIGALESYDRAAVIEPHHADLLCNRGSALLMMLRTEEALRDFDAALSLAPELPEAHHNRAQTLRVRGDPQGALEAFERALRVRPRYADALIGRGEALRELKRPTDALQSFERALALPPESAAARRGIGDALLDLGRAKEALAAHEAALRLGTERSHTLVSCGRSLRAVDRCTEAIAAFDESLRLDANNATAWCERGHTLRIEGNRVDEAIANFARALEINPDIPLLPGTLLYAQMGQAEWSTRVPCASREAVLQAVRVSIPACAPFAFLSVSDDPAAQFECARAFTRRELGTIPVSRPRPRFGHRRVRLAYVSADLREHAVSYLLAGVMEQHNRERFELSAIALRPAEESATGERIRRQFGRFIDVSMMNDRAIVELMRSLEIDIAVDLTGYTLGCRPRVLAAGVAPIQVSYLGYPGTLGGSLIDYLIADSFVVPEDHRQYYSESIAYLPECFQANDDRRVISERRFTRQEQGLPEASTVLCCLNTSHKINPPMFDVWMRLLRGAPEAVLWLVSHAPEIQDRLRREAVQRGVDPGRLVFAARLPYPEHLARLRLADLFLDTLPFNAGTTASDALWAGVPVLTCCGGAFAGRMAGSLLRNVGLPELVTTSLADYESLAAHLLAAPARLLEWRARLSANRHTATLFDTKRFTAHLEAAYLEMWHRHERGETPSTFRVDPLSTPS